MRYLKFLAIGIGGLLGLIAIAIVIIALTFDPNDYKEYAQTWVEERTGRSLNIDSDVELSLFPWLAVETGHVELGNAPGFGPEPFLAAQRVSARVRLMPLLLERQFEIGTVSIDALELDLATQADGTTNWADLMALGSQDDAAEPSTADDNATAQDTDLLSSLGIEGIALRGARIVWRENSEPRYIVSELSLSTGELVPGRPVDIELAADLLDVATQRTARIDLVTNAVADAAGALAANGSTIDFVIGDSSGNTDAQGRAEIETLSFIPGMSLTLGQAQLTNMIDSPLAAGSQLATDLRWSSLEADLAAMNLTVEDLVAQANGVRAAFRLVGEDLAGDTARLSGNVSFDESPAAALIELSGLSLPADIDVDALGSVRGSTAFALDFGSGDVELSNLELSMLGADVRAQSASLRGDTLSTQLSIAPFRPDQNLRRLVAPYLPEGVDVNQIGTLAFSGRISGTGQDIRVTGMRLSAVGAEISGDVNMTPIDAGMSYSGNVSSNRFETDELLGVMGALLPESFSSQTAGSAALSGAFTWNAATGAASVSGLRVEAFGMQGTADFNASGIGTATQASGRLTLSEFDPRELLNRFSLVVPQTSDETALRRATVDTRFVISPNAATFEDLVVNLDDSRMTGTFTVEDFEDPFFRFALSANRLDVDRYLPPQAPPGADNAGAADDGERRAGDIELSNEYLSAVNIDANVRVGQLRIAGMDFSNVATSMTVGSGRMLLDSAHADLYGGSFDGRFRVDASTDVPSMSLQGTAENLQLAPLITALAESSSLSGAGSFDIDLTGRGPTITDNLRSAAGTMAFELSNGVFEGFNLDKTLCRAFNSARGNPAPRDVPDRSNYESIRGTARVTDGIAVTNDLVATIGSAVVRGSGTLALADQIVDYHLEAQLARTVPIDGCAEMERIVGHDFPLEVEGPISGPPDIQPDYSEVIRRILEYRLREEARDRLLDRLLN